MNTQKQQKGFTIIEVVLVLAIAGLIFLMIFIALPALQRGQRDTQRRDDVSRFVTQLNSFSTNNNGNIPAESAIDDFAERYLKIDDGEFKDPQSGDNYTFVVGAGEPTPKTIQYATGAKCNGELVDFSPTGTRVAAVRVELEGSGIFCQDNQ